MVGDLGIIHLDYPKSQGNNEGKEMFKAWEIIEEIRYAHIALVQFSKPQ